MKCAISCDGMGAHHFERLGLARAFQYSGYECALWDIRAKSPYDFVDEYKPDILISQSYNISESTINLLKENPEIRLYLKIGDYSDYADSYDLNEYQILVASKEDVEKVKRIVDICKYQVLGGCHYFQKTLEKTHERWKSLGIKLQSSRLAWDLFDYSNSVELPEFKSDLMILSGYWPYKGKNANKYILPLHNPKYNYNIKIWGNSDWPTASYLGGLENEYVKYAMKSGTICLNISEPQAAKYRCEYPERPIKLAGNKCFCISDYCALKDNMFEEDEMIFCDTPEEYKEKIDYFLANPDERLPYIEKAYKKVLNGHSYFNVCSELMDGFGISHKILESYEKVKKELCL